MFVDVWTSSPSQLADPDRNKSYEHGYEHGVNMNTNTNKIIEPTVGMVNS